MIINDYMNRLKFLLFISLAGISLLFTTACHRCKDNNCVNVEVGSAAPADSSSNWIPFNSIDTVRFINSSSYSAQFVSTGYQNTSCILLGRTYDYNCGDPMEDCWEYYTMYEKSLKFISDSINLSIEYKIRKNIWYNSNFQNGLSTDTLTDVLMIKINYYSWAIPIQSGNYTEINCTTELFDSLTLNGTAYNNVYHSFQNNTNSGIAIKGIYFTKDNGLIGFYYNNDEKWYLQL
jgi:hypothetical protein